MYKIKLVDIVDGAVAVFGYKEFVCVDYPASDWVREEVKGLKTFDAPQMTSSTKVKQAGGRGSICEYSKGYLFNTSNNVYQGLIAVSLFTSTFSHGNGLSIIPENIHKVVALFTARKTITPNWINCKDEYSAPRETL
jgi:hypothetical protein